MATYTLTPSQLKGAGVYNSFEIPAGGGTPSFSNVNSFSFDGIDDYFLGAGTYSELDGQNKATFSMWVKPTLSANGYLVYTQETSATGTIQIGIALFSTGRIGAYVNVGGYYTGTATGAITANNWQHILVCIDLSASFSLKGKIFVNGSDVTTSNNLNRTTFGNSLSSLYIANNTALSLPYGGLMDEVAIWAGTDLRNDIATIYNNGTPTDLNNNGLTAPTTWQRMGDNATWNGATWTMTDVNGSYTNRSINMVEANRTTDVPT